MPDPVFSAPGDPVGSGGTLNKDDLIDYVRASLGEGVWGVELTERQIDIAISTAIRKYGRRLPFYRYGSIDAVEGQNKYTFPEDIDIGFGVSQVQFLRQAAFGNYGLINKSLLGITTVGSYRIDEYDIFNRWRQTFERVTSTLPAWKWEEDTKSLWIYNPIPLTKIAYMVMVPPKRLEDIRYSDEDWIYDYVTAWCRKFLGENRGKFSGAIPGPQKELNLNAKELVAEAKETLKELDTQLMSMQRRTPVEFF
jgi:hypothetical protein